VTTYITICKNCKDKVGCLVRTGQKTKDASYGCPYLVTGLGDKVAAFLKRPAVAGVVKALTGIDTNKPCGGCKKRREWLNEKVPLGKKVN